MAIGKWMLKIYKVILSILDIFKNFVVFSVFWDRITSFNEMCLFLCLIVVLKSINTYVKVTFNILFSLMIGNTMENSFKDLQSMSCKC